MYKKSDPQMNFIDDFYLPFGGFLRSDNRWVILSRNIPWEAIEAKYASLFSDVGQPAKPIRMAVGSLIIKERLQLSDEELVLQVAENHYLQYFLGLKTYQDIPPFDPSVLTKWRKRFTADILKDINRMIVEAQKAKQTPPPPGGAPSSSGGGDNGSSDADNRPNAGKMIIDATCAPADIKYPTDIGLLSDAREKLEELIDRLHAPLRTQGPKPRTYRQKARRIYLNIAKQKQPRGKSVRKAIGKQLRYIARDLRIIQALQQQAGAAQLTQRQQQYLETIRTLYSALAEYLKRRSGGLVRLSFGEIEKIIGGPLPQSAREHRAWWANDKFHSQGKAWLSAGWVSEDLDLEGKEISLTLPRFSGQVKSLVL